VQKLQKQQGIDPAIRHPIVQAMLQGLCLGDGIQKIQLKEILEKKNR